MNPILNPNIEPQYWTKYWTQYWAPILNQILNPNIEHQYWTSILSPILNTNIFDWNYNVYQNFNSCSSWYLLCPHSCLLFLCLYCIVQFCFSSLVIICFNNLHFFFNYNFQPNLFLAHGKKDFYSLHETTVVSRYTLDQYYLLYIMCAYFAEIYFIHSYYG